MEQKKRRPANPRAFENLKKALLVRFENDINQDKGPFADCGVPPLNKWPRFEKDRLLAFHKSHDDRFKLFTFLYANGVMPEVASEIVTYWMKNVDWADELTPKIVMDMKQMVADANAPIGTKNHFRIVKPRQFVVALGRPAGYNSFQEYKDLMGPSELARSTGFAIEPAQRRYNH
jgi:hypothetical protein